MATSLATSLDTLVEEERTRQKEKERLSFDVRVGFSYPLDLDTLHFNLHFSVDGFDWKEVVDYYTLEELHFKLEAERALSSSSSVTVTTTTTTAASQTTSTAQNTAYSPQSPQSGGAASGGGGGGIELPRFFTLQREGIASFNALLTEAREFNPQTIKRLDNHCKLLETWLVAILCNLSHLPEACRVACKALFFRSAEKTVKYEVLLAMFSRDGEQRDKDNGKSRGRRFPLSLSLSPQKAHAQHVLRSMQRLFGGSERDRERERDRESEIDSLAESLPRRKRSQESDQDSGNSSLPPRSPNAIGNKPPSRPKSLSWKIGNPFKRDRERDGERDDDDALFAIDEDRETVGNGSLLPNAIFNANPNGTISGVKPVAKSALDVAAKSVLLRVEVQRGEESQQGVVVYEIALRVIGKRYKQPMVYTVRQRYSQFKRLFVKLQEIDTQWSVRKRESGPATPYADFIHLISAPFPALPMKCYLGLSLNDSELSQRTRLLDAWFRDVCYFYRNMPNNARQEIRDFLKLDLTQQRDIFFQDQLAWGTIENEKSMHKPVLIVNQALLDNASDELLEEIETMTATAGELGNRATLSARQREQQQERLEAATVRSGMRDGDEAESGRQSVQLQHMLWETASMGGASKIPRHKAQTSRNIIKSMH